jgi:hypothetical protein
MAGHHIGKFVSSRRETVSFDGLSNMVDRSVEGKWGRRAKSGGSLPAG